MRAQALLAGACAAAIACAADAQRANPILEPEQPWAFEGFSVRPPAGAGWYSLDKGRTSAALGRLTRSPTHTLVAAVRAERRSQAFESPEALVADLRSRRERNPDRVRLEVRGSDARRDDLDGAWCARYRLDAEERVAADRLVILRIEARSCAHPSAPDLLIELSVSERGLREEAGEATRAETDRFLDSLRFTPPTPPADLVDADDLARRGASADAARLLEALAERGDPSAALRLARAYDSGRGVPLDPARAERLYRLAAAAGEVDALYNLGVFHERARGGERDVRQAMRWFRRAADQRDPQAQLNLGLLFYRGDGVPGDHVQARAWFELAADNGNARARELLRTLEFRAGPRDGLLVTPTVVLDPP